MDTLTVSIILAGIFPPLIWSLRLKDNEEKKKHKNQKIKTKEAEQEEGDAHVTLCATESPQCIKSPFSWIRETKLGMFYTTPIVKFWMNVIAFLVYLGLFAFIIMSNFSTDTVSVSVYEYVLFGWTVTLTFEEIREVITKDRRGVLKKIVLHIQDAWNIMDVLSMTLFYIGFGLRFSVQFLDLCLNLYSLTFMIECIRIIHIFAANHVLGPKLIMVGNMLKDLLFFLFIMIVFLLAYGVASQALLYPSETRLTEIIVGIIYKPYLQIYGEFGLNEINYDPKSDGYTCSDTNDNLPRCPQRTVLVPILSALYLLFTNVLLLNLLIAMFSYTFEKVQRQSAEIWKFERYKLIVSYYCRPTFVPPLIIISHITRCVEFIARKINPKLRSWRTQNDFKKEVATQRFKVLRKWEGWRADEFKREKHFEDEMKIDNQLENLSNRMDKVMATAEHIMVTAEDMQSRIKNLENTQGIRQSACYG